MISVVGELKAWMIGEGFHPGNHYTHCDPAKGQKLQNTVPCMDTSTQLFLGDWSPPTQYTCSLPCVWNSPMTPYIFLSSACQNSTGRRVCRPRILAIGDQLPGLPWTWGSSSHHGLQRASEVPAFSAQLHVKRGDGAAWRTRSPRKSSKCGEEREQLHQVPSLPAWKEEAIPWAGYSPTCWLVFFYNIYF